MDKSAIIKGISVLGFTNIDSEKQIYQKSYTKHNDYIITIDLSSRNGDINYGNGIIVHNKTSSNFSKDEFFVTLECINRLLKIGYDPQYIELEFAWRSGKRLDILIRDKDNKTYLMIECKVWGKEYNNAQKKMLKDGGQLFDYFNQDKDAKHMCLYTSRLYNDSIQYNNSIVKPDDNMRHLANVKEMHLNWNKQFWENGIFDSDVTPYSVKLKSRTKGDLREISEEDSGIIFNQFLEILRHNCVSDHTNAYNKLFNLFLCKICDEDKQDKEILDFQWIEGKSTHEELFDKLNRLYKEGMDKFLNKKITDYDDKAIEKAKKYDDIYKMLKELRLYKNQEFAFVEVFNEQSFYTNAKIVKEVVELLQGWKIKYTYKQPFLGEFFEDLLDSGFKQESGQYFTPVPLVKFILYSLPIHSIIIDKIKNKEKVILPYLIDYSCGSGHFLTEIMTIIQEEINKIDCPLSPSQKSDIAHYRYGDYKWAEEFIYGIEKDYRLVKTTKLACFMNGDGNAKIIHASGLAPFNDESYIGILRENSGTQDNLQFDILVTNPPYAVNGFKSDIGTEIGEKSFELYEDIPDNSNEIEVLFIERMKQLVKPNGIVAIILKSTILTNDSKNYSNARRIIFSYFEIKSVVKLESSAFKATGTNTIILFMKRREKPINLKTREDYQKMSENAKILVADSLDGKQELNFLGYKFSNRRNASKITEREGLLLNKDNLSDNNKLNFHVLNSMLNTRTEIPNILKKHVFRVNFYDCFYWQDDNFINSVNIGKNYKITSKWELVKISKYLNYFPGVTFNKAKQVSNSKTNIAILTADHITLVNKLEIKDEKIIYLKNDKDIDNNSKLTKDSIFFCTTSSKKHAGKCAYIDEDMEYYAGGFMMVCKRKSDVSEEEINMKYVYYVISNLEWKKTLNIVGGGGQFKNVKDFSKTMIPKPSPIEQQQIVNLMDNTKTQKERNEIMQKVFTVIELTL